MISKKIITRIKKTVAAAVIVAGCVVSYSFYDEFFEVTKNLDIFASMYRDINIYYVDSVNPTKLMRKGIDNMLTSLDPYTTFIPESDKDDYRYMTTGLYGGIGAMIKQVGDNVFISDPYEGYPAQRNGIVAGDKIVAVDGVYAKGKKT